ncbi:helix-turn-helix domain-containing protein [Nitrospirillum iridis]|uniref:AraC-like DNA-binding protein n=1 Tax=Nitrospirillum iridis TaxID=765888 RepID=A0A7X0AYF2_9PROT|nr:AraC family transcriptional regulator [Nitrospirillum iridis]MBB6252062.1 AraC-like DNA-binding protein [Nitrospirillum iridis]
MPPSPLRSPVHPGDDVSSTVADLLRRARQAFDQDLDTTRDCIARILVLMSPPEASGPGVLTPGPAGATEQEAEKGAARSMGGLAPWQERRVIAHIDANLAADLSNEALADLLQLSRSHFCAVFRRSLGASPRNFIIERRLAAATHLMLRSDGSLADIARACGFSDQAHFSRLFRRSRGETPSRWRRLRQSGPPGA